MTRDATELLSDVAMPMLMDLIRGNRLYQQVWQTAIKPIGDFLPMYTTLYIGGMETVEGIKNQLTEVHLVQSRLTDDKVDKEKQLEITVLNALRNLTYQCNVRWSMSDDEYTLLVRSVVDSCHRATAGITSNTQSDKKEDIQAAKGKVVHILRSEAWLFTLLLLELIVPETGNKKEA